jgi:hypothetical protein
VLSFTAQKPASKESREGRGDLGWAYVRRQPDHLLYLTQLEYKAIYRRRERSYKTISSDTLEVIQNRRFRTISGAYRATPTQLLESETGILPLWDHLSMLHKHLPLSIHLECCSIFPLALSSFEILNVSSRYECGFSCHNEAGLGLVVQLLMI